MTEVSDELRARLEDGTEGDILDITDEELAEVLGQDPPILAPALAIGARVSREPHPDFPDVENVTFLELIVQAPIGEDGAIVVAVLPIILDNELADDLGLTPEVVLTSEDFFETGSDNV